MRLRLATVFAFAASTPILAQQGLPIIDMHLHALAADQQGPPPLAMCTPFPDFPAWDPSTSYQAAFLNRQKKPPCANPVWSPMTDNEVMTQTIQIMDRLNVYGVLGGTPDRVATWMNAAPRRFLPGLDFRIGTPSQLSVDSLRRLHAAGRLAVLAEVTNEYAGIAPDDPRMEPYWALAEELDIPVGIHVGPGPMGVIYMGASHYRARLHSALTMEEVLVRHPKLRVYLMHAGYPMLEDLLALLYAHPQAYVDVGIIVNTQPREAFYRYLRGIADAGFLNRVMYGTDQMVWPGTIERGIATINQAPFLSAQQKRDILYNNAARFLRLPREYPQFTKQSALPMPKSHQHCGVAGYELDDSISEFRLADATGVRRPPRDSVKRSPDGRHEAFSRDLTHLYVVDVATRRMREVVLPLEGRPFADLVWVNDTTLMFDRWSQPHYAMHYAVDVTSGKLIAAQPFPEATRAGCP